MAKLKLRRVKKFICETCQGEFYETVDDNLIDDSDTNSVH
jgi:hypothetical protein